MGARLVVVFDHCDHRSENGSGLQRALREIAYAALLHSLGHPFDLLRFDL
jgi:hypothetical protein